MELFKNRKALLTIFSKGLLSKEGNWEEMLITRNNLSNLSKEKWGTIYQD